ncbi:MAG: thiamine pyrophosphate-dependent enzyme, partial [Thermoplasmata archaeon]
DNEAYMNTGTQRSGSTPLGAWTTTTPVGGAGRGKEQPKKDMMGIILAHRVPYAATASVAFPEDLVRKARKAREIAGPTFLHIFSPCPPGWRFSSEKSVEIARLAVDAKVFPLYEVEEGTYRINRNPRKPIPVSDYMSLQERFGHLTKKMMELFQAEVDRNWEMLLRMVEITEEKPLWG